MKETVTRRIRVYGIVQESVSSNRKPSRNDL